MWLRSAQPADRDGDDNYSIKPLLGLDIYIIYTPNSGCEIAVPDGKGSRVASEGAVRKHRASTEGVGGVLGRSILAKSRA